MLADADNNRARAGVFSLIPAAGATWPGLSGHTYQDRDTEHRVEYRPPERVWRFPAIRWYSWSRLT